MDEAMIVHQGTSVHPSPGAVRVSYQISRIVTDPPSDAGARIRALGFAA